LKRFKRDDEGTAKLVEYLKSEGVEIDFESVDRKMLDKANIRVAIKKQLANEKKVNKIIIKD
jgi:ferritin